MLVNYLFVTISSTFKAYKNSALTMALCYSDTSSLELIQSYFPISK